MDADVAPDIAPDTKWLTFNEIAENRSISVPSAMRLVRRRHWRRQRDNHGRVTVAVPVDELRAPDEEPDASQAISAIRAAYETTIETLRDHIAAKQQVIDVMGQQVETLKQAADISDATSVELREELAEARAAVMRAELAHATAAEALAQAERREVARLARGRWARLRAAWRGR